MMYDPNEIRRLTKEYVKTGNDEIFEELLTEQLRSLMKIQLAKYYKEFPFWEDMESKMVLYLWRWHKGERVSLRGYKFKRKPGKNTLRQSIKESITKDYFQFFWTRIRYKLNDICTKIKQEYEYFFDDSQVDVKRFDDLTLTEKRKLGIEPENEDWDIYGS